MKYRAKTNNMKNNKLVFLLGSFLLGGIVISGCKKSSESNSQLTVNMTDAPFDAQEVNVDIKEVRVNFAKDTAGWVTLNTNARIYNLLTLQNNRDTVIASSSISADTVKELRLILGTENSIKIKDIVYPLSVASGDESGLKIKVDKNMNAGLNDVLIDFDADLSIIQTGTGQYKLKPVIRLKK